MALLRQEPPVGIHNRIGPGRDLLTLTHKGVWLPEIQVSQETAHTRRHPSHPIGRAGPLPHQLGSHTHLWISPEGLFRVTLKAAEGAFGRPRLLEFNHERSHASDLRPRRRDRAARFAPTERRWSSRCAG